MTLLYVFIIKSNRLSARILRLLLLEYFGKCYLQQQILFQTETAAVQLRPLQSVMNAAACLVVKESGEEVGQHYADDSLWHVTLAPGSRTNRLQALSSSLQVSSPARRPVPRVDDRSSFGSVDASPPTVCRSRWPCSTEEQNCRLRSLKFLSRWSVTHCGILCRLTWNCRLYIYLLHSSA